MAINCSFAKEPTLSIQYRPDSSVGLAMAPVVLDWATPKGAALDSELVWEPGGGGAFARDGIYDRNASKVAEVMKATPGTLRVVAADGDGKPFESLYDSAGNFDAITRVLAQCPWNPQPNK